MRYKLRTLLLIVTLLCVGLGTARFWAVRPAFTRTNGSLGVHYPPKPMADANLESDRAFAFASCKVYANGKPEYESEQEWTWMGTTLVPADRHFVTRWFGIKTIFGWSWWDVVQGPDGTIEARRRFTDPRKSC